MTPYIELFAADEIETGLWCPRCLLPSGVQVTVMVRHPDGTIGEFGKFRACSDCGEVLR